MKKKPKKSVAVSSDRKTGMKRAQQDRAKFLELLFQHGELSIDAIAQALRISGGMAEYHRDILSAGGMITETYTGFEWLEGSRRQKYVLLPRGREYVVKCLGA